MAISEAGGVRPSSLPVSMLASTHGPETSATTRHDPPRPVAASSRQQRTDGEHRPTTATATATAAAAASSSVVRSRSPRRGAKTHVASACYNCKRAHLACDESRPCQRCRASGKIDGCYDVQHKKRGRPKLKDRKANTPSRRALPEINRAANHPPAAAMCGAVALGQLPSLSLATDVRSPTPASRPQLTLSAVAPQPVSALPSAMMDVTAISSSSSRYHFHNGCCSPAPSDSPVSMQRDEDLRSILPPPPPHQHQHQHRRSASLFH
ncbi:hypothetical protein SYNPS1DRAFT_32175, partial [Syncephalis pseudoplumigaleata]